MNHRIIVALTTSLVVACAPLRAPSRGTSPAYDLLQPQRDSFVVLSRGRAVGFQRTNLERTPGGYRLHDEVRVEGALSQSTEVEFSAEGSTRSAAQNGNIAAPVHIKLEYIGDGVRGGVTTPSAGRTARAIDIAMPAETVDDNLVAMLVPTLAWSRDARYTITISHLDSIAASYWLTVTGLQRVTVPSGSYDTYKVELIGDAPEQVLLFVTVARPHRLVKVVPVGERVEFVLASGAATANGAR